MDMCIVACGDLSSACDEPSTVISQRLIAFYGRDTVMGNGGSKGVDMSFEVASTTPEIRTNAPVPCWIMGIPVPDVRLRLRLILGLRVGMVRQCGVRGDMRHIYDRIIDININFKCNHRSPALGDDPVERGLDGVFRGGRFAGLLDGERIAPAIVVGRTIQGERHQEDARSTRGGSDVPRDR